MSAGAHPSPNGMPSVKKATSLAEHLAARAALAALKSPPAPETAQALAPKTKPSSSPSSNQGADQDTNSETTRSVTDEDAGNDTEPSFENSAVARCRKIYCNTLAVGRDTGVSLRERKSDADHAYRCSMPALHGRQNIVDFVACVAQGMLFEIFNGSEGTCLLYAAQVAYTTSPAPLSAPHPPLPARRIHRKKSDIAS